MTASCPTCDRRLDEHNRHIRFGVPEPVLSIPEEERAALTWGHDVLMQVEGIGGFVRILVPVKLTGGYRVTYGAWFQSRLTTFVERGRYGRIPPTPTCVSLES
jgi:hypothetical protein